MDHLPSVFDMAVNGSRNTAAFRSFLNCLVSLLIWYVLSGLKTASTELPNSDIAMLWAAPDAAFVAI